MRQKQAEWELELEHFQKQKSTVTNEREFTAVISEIDYATRAIDESSAQTPGARGVHYPARAGGYQPSRRTPGGGVRPRRCRDLVGPAQGRAPAGRCTELATRAKKLEADIQPKLRAHFLRLLESKHGTAISEVVDESCSLCHLALRPHLQQRVRRCEEIIDCEHCHRILYVNQILTQVENGVADG